MAFICHGCRNIIEIDFLAFWPFSLQSFLLFSLKIRGVGDRASPLDPPLVGKIFDAVLQHQVKGGYITHQNLIFCKLF